MIFSLYVQSKVAFSFILSIIWFKSLHVIIYDCYFTTRSRSKGSDHQRFTTFCSCFVISIMKRFFLTCHKAFALTNKCILNCCPFAKSTECHWMLNRGIQLNVAVAVAELFVVDVRSFYVECIFINHSKAWLEASIWMNFFFVPTTHCYWFADWFLWMPRGENRPLGYFL